MDYFEQSARLFIKAVVAYYEETGDTSIASLSLRGLSDRMCRSESAIRHLEGFYSLLEQEQTQESIGPVPAVIASVKKIWQEEYFSQLNINILASEKIECDKKDIRHIVSHDKVDILDTIKELIIRTISINPEIERFLMYNAHSDSAEDKEKLIAFMLESFHTSIDKVELAYFDRFGNKTTSLIDSSFAVAKSATKLTDSPTASKN